MPKLAVILLPGILGCPLENLKGGDAWPVHKLSASNIGTVYWWYNATFMEKLEGFGNLVDFIPYTKVVKADIKKEKKWPSTDKWNIYNVAGIYHDFLTGLLERSLAGPDGVALGLVDDSYLVHVVNYDWARPVKESYRAVAKDTHEFVTTNNCDKFIYVTHSMGGIVGMAALLNSWVQENCLGIVRVACPVLGAPEATARLVRGILPGDTTQGEITSVMLGNTGRKFSLFAAYVQGLASLLPQWGPQSRINKNHVEAILKYHFNMLIVRGGDEDSAAALFGYKNLSSLIYRFGENITLANEFMGVLNRKALLFHKYVTAITLLGKKTLDSFDVNASLTPPYINPTFKESLDGDGTVPIWSQACFSGRQVYVDGGIDHASALSDKRTWPHIIQAMNELIKMKR